MSPPIHWNDSTDADVLQPIVAQVLGQGDPIEVPLSCPGCGTTASVHAYLHRHLARSGGVWVWCSECGRFLHDRVQPPEWWQNLPDLHEDELSAVPERLDQLADAIDAHWMHLRGAA